ncbi:MULTISPECIES: hypothetical protein [Pseudomonas]|nr:MULTISPECIES: hypothetical protein [unclassified Pseudomonas]
MNKIAHIDLPARLESVAIPRQTGEKIMKEVQLESKKAENLNHIVAPK